MKKPIAILTTGFTAAALLSLTAFPVSAAQITETGAKQIALEHAGIKEKDTSYLKVKSDTDDNRDTYEVKFFTKSYAEYEYEILAENGTILKIDYDAEAPISKNRNGKNPSAWKTLEKAKKIALSHAGFKEDSVTFEKAESDDDGGNLIYEIEFTAKDQTQYEFEIDAATGMILAWSYDAENALKKPEADDSKDSRSGKNNTLGDAKKLALKQAGLKENQITWGRVKKDYDDGKTVYEGKFFYKELEYEFEIDAATMTFLEWEVENIYD